MYPKTLVRFGTCTVYVHYRNLLNSVLETEFLSSVFGPYPLYNHPSPSGTELITADNLNKRSLVIKSRPNTHHWPLSIMAS